MGLEKFFSEFSALLLVICRQLYGVAIFLLYGHVLIECTHFTYRQLFEPPELFILHGITIKVFLFLAISTITRLAKIIKVEYHHRGSFLYIANVGSKFLCDLAIAVYVFVEHSSSLESPRSSQQVYVTKSLLLINSLAGFTRSIYDLIMAFDVISLPPVVFFSRFSVAQFVEVAEVFVRFYWLNSVTGFPQPHYSVTALFVLLALLMGFFTSWRFRRERLIANAYWQKLSTRSIEEFDRMFMDLEPSVKKARRKEDLRLKKLAKASSNKPKKE